MDSIGKKFTNGIRKMLFDKYFKFFLNGFLLATMLYFYMEDSYENRLFEALASYVKEPQNQPHDEKDILIKSLNVTYHLGAFRKQVFGTPKFNSLNSSIFHPVTYDLMTANSACGSYTFILSRLLNELHVKVRIAQMEVNGIYGGHILLEAQTRNGWVVLDPLYNLFFTRPDGTLASFDDVHNNWPYYKHQVPAGYDLTYRYEGVRYTNWQKIPVVMPFLKKVVALCIGKEKTQFFSLRVLALREYHLLFLLTATLYLLLLIFTIRQNIQYVQQMNFRFAKSSEKNLQPSQ